MSNQIVSSEEIPQWITCNFLRDLLKLSGDVELKTVSYACKKGENFGSKIYRIELLCESERQIFILKSRPFGGNSAFSEDFLEKFNVFAKEKDAYFLIEKFENLFHEINNYTQFSPRCLTVTSQPTDVLIIEDLCQKGYYVAPKSGLNCDRMKIVLRKLSQFHAASAIYYERNGQYKEQFSRGVYNYDMKSVFDQHYDYNFTFIINEIFSTWSGLDKKIIDKMNNWRNNILNELIRTMQSKENQFNCLNHGDCWISNILFLDDDNGNPIDCSLIDFQYCVYASPAVDLLTLIISSAETDTKFKNLELYIKFYHENLVEALHMLNYPKKMPTLKEIYIDVVDRGFLGVWNGFVMLPTCLAENVEESSSDNLLGSNEEGQNYKKKLYNNIKYREHMIELLTYFDNRGLVEFC